MSIVPKAFYKYNKYLSNSSDIFFFADIVKYIVRIVWTFKDSQIPRTVLKKMSKFGGFTLPDFKIYYEGTVIKTVWFWPKDRNID